MRTLTILSTATKSNAPEAIKLAYSRGWTQEQITRLGSEAVKAALRTAQASTRPAGARPQAQPAGARAVAEAKPSKVAPAPRRIELSRRVPVKLAREGEAELVLLDLLLSEPRAKLRGEGKTYDAALDGTAERFTMSPIALDRLLNGNGTRVWMNGKSYTAVRA